MNCSHAIQMAILATPGMRMRELAVALNMDTPKGRQRISVRLSQLGAAKKLRRENRPGSGPSGSRFWPTATTAVDRRQSANKPGEAAERKRAGMRAARARQKAGTATPAAKTKAALTPAPAVVTPPPSRATAKPQTVAEFLANGGVIQHLPPHWSANPLRFDHSGTPSQVGRRRPTVRAYPAASHA